MGIIRRLPGNRVAVYIGPDELLTEKAASKTGEVFSIGSLLIFIAQTKLTEKKVEYPCGGVKVSFDDKELMYEVLFFPPLEKEA